MLLLIFMEEHQKTNHLVKILLIRPRQQTKSALQRLINDNR